MSFKWKTDEIGIGNRNHYTDAYEEFYQMAINETEQKLVEEQVRQNFFVPLINFTNINQNLKKAEN